MRVMQSFGEPRSTTNPYLVMLRDALVAEPTVDHLPFSWRSALTERYDVLHVHWPDALLAGRHWWTRAGKRAALACLVARLRFGRIAVVRTVHNITPPPGGHLDRALIGAVERRTDVQVRISASTPEATGVPSVLIPHGHYRAWFERMPRADVVPGRLAYVGLIKPYKGVERLVDVFAEASAADPTISLCIAGNPFDQEAEHRLRVATENDPRVRTILRHLSDEEFVEIVTSSELVVLPYRFMHNSGVVLAALSLARPVLVPDNELNRALSDEVGPGWVHRFTGELSAGALLDALQELRTAPPREAPELGARGWADAGAAHARAYGMAIDRRRRRRNVPVASVEVPRA